MIKKKVVKLYKMLTKDAKKEHNNEPTNIVSKIRNYINNIKKGKVKRGRTRYNRAERSLNQSSTKYSKYPENISYQGKQYALYSDRCYMKCAFSQCGAKIRYFLNGKIAQTGPHSRKCLNKKIK